MTDERYPVGPGENEEINEQAEIQPEETVETVETVEVTENAEQAQEVKEELPEAPSQENPEYAWSASRVHVHAQQEDAQQAPPSWEESRQADASRINMQVNKKKKKRKWVVGIIIAAVAVYLLLTGILIFGAGKMFTNFVMRGDNNGLIFGNTEQPPVQEHLQIQNTPDSQSSAPVAGQSLTVKQIAKKVRTSVVGIVAEGNMNLNSSSVGSGIIMSADGYIITNNHVIENTSKITVVMDDGTNYDAYVIGTDSRTDLAVLKVDATNLPAAEFGDSDKLEQGDMAVAIGNPAGIQLQNTVTSGIISAINRNIVVEDEEMTLIQTDASINPGNSGGPLVNEYGQVIGINTVKIGISYYEGLGFAIPINTAKPIIDELISRGYITGRPSIGINGQTLGERDAMFYGLKAGMYVQFVHPYSDAYRKGLQAGDVITELDGKPLSSTEDLKKLRDEHKAGDTVTLTIYRNGREFKLNVVLMDEAELNKMGQPNGYGN